MGKIRFPWAVIAAVLIAASIPSGWVTAQTDEFSLSSPAFDDGSAIPLPHSGYGENHSPALTWSGAPEGVHSFAIVLEDLDAPGSAPFVHWVVYNIPGWAKGLPEGITTMPALDEPRGTLQGVNGLRRVGYFGPRPPAGDPHRYTFRLYALVSQPDLPEGLNRAALMKAIAPHVIAETSLTGTFSAP